MNKFVKLILAGVVVAAFALTACGGDSQPQAQKPAAKAPAPKAALVGDAAAGKTEYAQFCSACHGPDAKGLKGLGKDLTASDFVKKLSDEELLHYVIKGRAADDPLNTTGIPMPPKGGNPALTDQQIADIISYLRTFYK